MAMKVLNQKIRVSIDSICCYAHNVFLMLILYKYYYFYCDRGVGMKKGTLLFILLCCSIDVQSMLKIRKYFSSKGSLSSSKGLDADDIVVDSIDSLCAEVANKEDFKGVCKRVAELKEKSKNKVQIKESDHDAFHPVDMSKNELKLMYREMKVKNRQLETQLSLQNVKLQELQQVVERLEFEVQQNQAFFGSLLIEQESPGSKKSQALSRIERVWSKLSGNFVTQQQNILNAMKKAYEFLNGRQMVGNQVAWLQLRERIQDDINYVRDSVKGDSDDLNT